MIASRSRAEDARTRSHLKAVADAFVPDLGGTRAGGCADPGPSRTEGQPDCLSCGNQLSRG